MVGVWLKGRGMGSEPKYFIRIAFSFRNAFSGIGFGYVDRLNMAYIVQHFPFPFELYYTLKS